MTLQRALSVTFLDVGQGDASIIVPPEGEGDPVVLDAGSDGWVVTQQLLAWGVDRLEAVIASHLDIDHIGGMATLLDEYGERTKVVYCSTDRDLSGDEGDAKKAKELVDSVREGPWEVEVVQGSSRPISCGKDWSIHVLAPSARHQLDISRTGSWEDPNRYSAVVQVKMKDRVVLLGADAPLATWSEIQEGPNKDLSSDVFRIPHHGGAIDDGGVPLGWSAERLYDDVGPRTAVVSAGTNNGHGHPSTEWMGPLIARSGCRLLCTQVTGRCHQRFALESRDDRHQAIRTARERILPAPLADDNHFAEPPWRHYTKRKSGVQLNTPARDRLEVPCAGTISVRIDEGGELVVDPTPEHPSLVARIGRWSDPMCRRRSDQGSKQC